MPLSTTASQHLFKFITNRSGPYEGEVILDKNKVYILPTRIGLLFGVLLLLLLLGSVNYEKSLGYALTFLLAGVGNIGLILTWKNIKGVALRSAGGASVHAGQQAMFSVQCTNPDDWNRYAITLHHDGVEYDVKDVVANDSVQLHLKMETERRGRLRTGPVKLATEFPLGLFVAWTWIDLGMECIVYPAPASGDVERRREGDEAGDADIGGSGQEVFEGLRNYRQGDSWRRVSWKAFARNNELMVKNFSGGAPSDVWIDWEDVLASNTEAKLSSLCRLVIDAAEEGLQFGLRLPATVIEPDRGEAHRHRCLTALALYEN